jgi:2-iminobutanoate/2-iminopropanoate deaminase
MKTFRDPDGVHRPVAAYTHQIEVTGDERLLVLSGQVGMAEDGTVPTDPFEQLEVALDNVEANLAAAQMSMQDVVKLTFYLVGEMAAPRRQEAIARHLGGHKPCMTLIYVAALAAPRFRVEIDAWASRSTERLA